MRAFCTEAVAAAVAGCTVARAIRTGGNLSCFNFWGPKKKVPFAQNSIAFSCVRSDSVAIITRSTSFEVFVFFEDWQK